MPAALATTDSPASAWRASCTATSSTAPRRCDRGPKEGRPERSGGKARCYGGFSFGFFHVFPMVPSVLRVVFPMVFPMVPPQNHGDIEDMSTVYIHILQKKHLMLMVCMFR